jgi:hypothetical protein
MIQEDHNEQRNWSVNIRDTGGGEREVLSTEDDPKGFFMGIPRVKCKFQGDGEGIVFNIPIGSMYLS